MSSSSFFGWQKGGNLKTKHQTIPIIGKSKVCQYREEVQVTLLHIRVDQALKGIEITNSRTKPQDGNGAMELLQEGEGVIFRGN